MKTRPISFTGESVAAILEGRKTQTRRVINKPQEIVLEAERKILSIQDALNNHPEFANILVCHYGIPGDLLWIRETWAELDDTEFGGIKYFEYKRNSGDPYPGGWPAEEAKGNPDAPKWKSARFMPRRAAAIFLLITNIRVERLQDISSDDAYDEGFPPNEQNKKMRLPREWFQDYWDSINSKRGYPWELNPWVWVIDFKITEDPDAYTREIEAENQG